MLVDFVVGGISSKSSGVASVITDLTGAMGKIDTQITVFSVECKNHGIGAIPVVPPALSVTRPGRWMGRLSYSKGLKQALDEHIPTVDLVHIHSLWTLPNSYGSLLAYKHGKPVVVSPHGSLESWAMKRSGWKKRVCEYWFQRKELERAQCIHALCDAEVEGFRSFGLTNPVAVIPNGVDLDAFANMPDSTEFTNLFPHAKDKRIVLFLSRVHPKKGLAHLLKAWKQIVHDYHDVILVVAGPDDGHLTAINDLTTDLELQNQVLFTGALYGREKLAAFSAAEFYVLPSFSEGFSMAILEAMASELPVLISDKCNFPEVSEFNAGLVVSANALDTEKGLRELLSMGQSERINMGRQGRALIESSYSWDQIAQKYLDLYEWITGKASKPETVE